MSTAARNSGARPETFFRAATPPDSGLRSGHHCFESRLLRVCISRLSQSWRPAYRGGCEITVISRKAIEVTRVNNGMVTVGICEWIGPKRFPRCYKAGYANKKDSRPRSQDCVAEREGFPACEYADCTLRCQEAHYMLWSTAHGPKGQKPSTTLHCEDARPTISPQLDK